MKNLTCPKCGKEAVAIRNYKNGSRLFIHKQEVTMAGVMAFNDILESCQILAPEPKHE